MCFPEALQGGLANIHGAGNVVLYKDTGVCRVDNFLTREGRYLTCCSSVLVPDQDTRHKPQTDLLLQTTHTPGPRHGGMPTSHRACPPQT
jgi:hypothetical protein